MKRKLFSAVLAALLATVLVIPSFAAEVQEPDMVPYVVNVTPRLSFDGETAQCSVTIMRVGKSISARLELWQGNTRLISWSDTATSKLTISEEYPVVSGKTYTLKVFGTVGEETISAAPVSGTC